MCGPRARERAARVEDVDRLTPSSTFALAHHPSGRSRGSAGCRHRDAVAKRGSARSGHGRAAELRRQGRGGRERPRWWRGTGSFAVTPTSGDRHGWSGIESWRDDAPGDSQHFSQDYSQQCSQTSNRDGFFGSTTHSNTHRPRSQPSNYHLRTVSRQTIRSRPRRVRTSVWFKSRESG